MKEYKNTRNPILPPDIHIPDGEAHVMSDGVLYIYGSFDDNNDVYCSERYYVVSTQDMKHWTIHEESLNGKQISWFNQPTSPKYQGIDWEHPTPFIQKMIQRDLESGVDMKAKFEEETEKEKPPLLFAPDCIEKDGKYYLYFCMSDDSEGVAVSERPEGPFKNPLQLPCGGIDPAIFVDEDGQAYYYWGQLISHGVKLNSDMVSFETKNTVDGLVTEEEHFFHEGSSMRKIKDTYYYVYTNMKRGKPTSLGYATSNSPLGPFVYRGIIIDNDGCDPASWNNHGSIESVNGQWYVFYHRCSRGVQQNRRLCIEPINILPDGTIPEVKMTSQGIGKPFDTEEIIKGYQACELTGEIFIGMETDDITGQQEYREVLMNIADGDEAVFRYVKNENSYTQIHLDVVGSGTIEVLFDGKNVGKIKIEEGKQITNQINMEAGEYELKFRFLKAESLKVREFFLR